MSYKRRRVELMNCDCSLFEGTVQTVHCEDVDGKMGCEVCGKIKEKGKEVKSL